MKPTIEPIPPDAIKRRVFGIHSWPLVGAGDVAVHEAGHIVVGMALGMPCPNARISPDGAAGQAGVLSPVSAIATADTLPAPENVADIYRQAAPLVWPGLPSADAALRYATMLVAGRQAELIAAGHRLAGELRLNDPDHQQARAILAATDQRLAMTWVQRQARHLLTTAWPDVQAIANTLREQGRWINSTKWER
ncbi:MAG: hypothetical protein Q8N48_02570 [Thiobacillus sp.]|nr:hypothetical protein [Thiobacillus sp.]MDP2977693.1 hypothetical protein [Thiobacillus sp.]